MKFKHLLSVLNKSNKTQLNIQKYSTAPGIDIPKRIPRGPTDILKAIASTHQRDPTAAHYKYHDDPYLIPYSHSMKRSYALSQESGRKAAQWIRQQHPELFQHKVAEPMIEAFVPKPVYTEDSEVNENVLLNLINSALVTDALTVYGILKSKGIEVSASTKQSLLECLCFFNSEDTVSEDWIEERWFQQSGKDKDRNIWRPHAVVQELFDELKDSNPASYSAIICGMCKHGEINKAMQVYEETQSKSILLNVEAFNALLSKAYVLKENHSLVLDLIKEILHTMNNLNVRPNVRTLNGVLESASRMLTGKQEAMSFALQTIAEFKSISIEPSLASYKYLLDIFLKDRSKCIGTLTQILNEIQEKTFTIEDSKDVLFFTRSMEICSQFKNKDLGYRLQQLLMKGNHYNLIGDSFMESVYYRNFFFLLTNTESLSTVMEFYDKLVPSIYIPEPSVTNAILNALYDNMAWDLLPRMWSDILLFEQFEISGVLENTVKCAAGNTDSSLNESMCKVAWSVWEKVDSPRRERIIVQWTGSMLGNIVLTFLKGNEKAKAHLAMGKLMHLGSSLMNEPPVEAMQLYINCCIEEVSPDLAIKAIQYCDDVGFVETSKFAQQLNSTLVLSEMQHQKLASIVGVDCLKKATTKEGS